MANEITLSNIARELNITPALRNRLQGLKNPSQNKR